MQKKFPLLELSGTPQQIGFKHGLILRERISLTLDFYRRTFKRSPSKILQEAVPYRKIIWNYSPEYAQEIEAIAKGAKVNPLWIYALNARTELFPSPGTITDGEQRSSSLLDDGPQECTSAYFRDSSFLVQNWDWAKKMENLAVLLHIRRNGHQILMVTEPGIIGKIGFNDKGIGVALNFLDFSGDKKGVPVHILLRSVLDSSSLEDARKRIIHAARGTASSLLIADSQGRSLNFEFAGTKLHLHHPNKKIFIHTNHYLYFPKFNRRKSLASSFARYRRANSIAESFSSERRHGTSENTLRQAKRLLLDKKGFRPICREYWGDSELGTLGTVCSIIMDLPNRKMHYTPGTPLKNSFRTVSLDK
jgi:isopenicillin-N N-acyltransferase-like protein